MKPANPKASLRCAVYTRVSTEHGLEQEFNSLDNQREASEAYIKSQAHEGWRLMRGPPLTAASLAQPAPRELEGLRQQLGADELRLQQPRVAIACKAKGYRTKRNLKAIVYLIAGDVLANSPI